MTSYHAKTVMLLKHMEDYVLIKLLFFNEEQDQFLQDLD